MKGGYIINNLLKALGVILIALMTWTLPMGQVIAGPVNIRQDTSSIYQREEGNLVDQLKQLTGDKVRIGMHAITEKVRYIGVNPSDAIRQIAILSAKPTPEEAARGFLSTYGSLFGLTDQAQELRVMHTKNADRGRSFVRFQQVHSYIPILGGELIVQVDSLNNIISGNGEILPNIHINTSPSISVEMAKEKSLALVSKHYRDKYNVDMSVLEVSKPELWIYNPILLGVNNNFTRLVWRMEVFPTKMLPIKELVLIDAHLGNVALHFNQIDTALYRIIYDQNNVVPPHPLPGNPEDLIRSEGQDPSGITDVDNAYDYAGDTYNFYWNYHGRDSLDNAGMQLISTTRYCPDATHCPYENAYWDGTQMVYGEGYASADDVVGHEMTHGVTDHESRLFYYMQSGAINEAFSDIWGEFIDLTNGRGNDSASVRWLLGEDLPTGAIRSMSNPPLYGDPDRMGSSNYNCGSSDGGGVHTNSGVANKTAYLMADGATFNGTTVTGIGITKAAKIFYEVQTHLFTSASDYNDLYDALRQACTNLTGTSDITTSDCQQVENAVNATEMNQQTASCIAKEASVCVSGEVSSLFFDNLENLSSGNWTHAALSGSDQWYYPQTSNPYDFDATYATSGDYNFWGYNYNRVSDSYIAMTQNVTLPAGAYLHFNHAYTFERGTSSYFDGGVIEYSTDNGTTWTDAGSLITNNGYTGTISTLFSNPLGDRQAFVGRSNGYMSTRLNLNSLSGQNVRFRFRIGTDSSVDDYGWFIDDIQIYTCASGGCNQSGFNEDFNDGVANDWVNDESGRWSVTGGNYKMTGTGANSWAGSLYNAPYCDFVYQAKVKRTSGPLTQSMGLFLRADNPNPYAGNGYGFYITADGYYSLWKYTSGSPSSLIPSTSSSAINTGLGNWNILKVVTLGSKISVYVNGTLLGSVNDSLYLSGKVGVGAFDQSSSPYSVAEFDFVTLDITRKMTTVDFDGDGATDVAAFHLPSDQFFTDYAGNLGQFGWGGSDSMPLIWDYDGDGKTDVSIYHIPTNQWFVQGVGNLGQYGWGGEDSIPVPGDYNGDGRMERAFYHSPTNQWFVEGQDPVTFGWNGAECIPLPGDYDGDGKTDMVIYHIPSNQWFQYGVGNLGQFGWGGADCIPVPGDYNGDGKTEIAVYHVPTNQWFLKGIGNLGQYGWGGLESFPIPGDYNGDGVMERGFYRPNENQWFIEGETDFIWGWGGSDFMPITSHIAVYNWFRFMLHKFE